MNLLQRASSLILGTLSGTVWPPRAVRVDRTPSVTARTRGLRALRDLLTCVVFEREKKVDGETQSFMLDADRILVDYPTTERNLKLPSIAFVPGRGVHDMTIGPPEPEDDTFGVYAPGTALMHLSDWIEPVGVEVISSFSSHREGISAGVVAVLRAQEEGTLRLKLPGYFDQVATFELVDQERIDDAEIVKGRRREVVTVEMTVPEVVLVNAVTLRPILDLEVLNPEVELTVD